MGTETMSVENNTGCGCITTIIAAFLAWALLFGVNYKGKHYGLSCGKSGVTIQDGD